MTPPHTEGLKEITNPLRRITDGVAESRSNRNTDAGSPSDRTASTGGRIEAVHLQSKNRRPDGYEIRPISGAGVATRPSVLFSRALKSRAALGEKQP